MTEHRAPATSRDGPVTDHRERRLSFIGRRISSGGHLPRRHLSALLRRSYAALHHPYAALRRPYAALHPPYAALRHLSPSLPHAEWRRFPAGNAPSRLGVRQNRSAESISKYDHAWNFARLRDSKHPDSVHLLHHPRDVAAVPNANLMGPAPTVFATVMGPPDRQGHGATREVE
jgi:hypothetical protein